jgi:SAM-dependent methyltransferase
MADDTLHTRDDNASEDLSSTRLFGCDKVVFGTLIVSVVALLLPTLLFFRSHRRPTTTTTTSSSSLTPPLSESHLVVPFIFLRDSDSSSSNSIRKPLEHTLRSTFTGYQRECSNAMTGLSKMLEMALVSEADRNYHDNIGNNKKSNNKAKDQKLLLSTKIERRIQRTAVCIEHDEDILKQLLGNFSYVLALPDKPYNKKVVVPREDDVNDIRRKNDILKEGRSTLFHLCDPRVRVTNQLDSYDSATQIWAHLVRDWTIEGQKIRHIIYDWCYDQMEIYSFKSGSSVLVPGAGMGRLDYDLSQRGYHVEANELSPSMAAAASSVLRNETYGIFHPYVLDAMSNEVDSKQRFGSVSFPDTSINGFSAEVPGSLSYTVGSFVGENDDYYQRQRAGYFDAVVSSSSTATIHTQLKNLLLFIVIYMYTNFISLL